MKFGLRTFSLFFFLTANFLLLTSCSIANRNVTHILIIAVDQFGYENLKCNKDIPTNPKSGIEILCHDSIRFTHAYTTSQKTRPAIASILTAKAPFENHVQDNDTSSLTSKQHTIAEAAFKAGYETGFFVGSPVTFRNSGLQQGFQFFDDHYLVEKTFPFRHFQDLQTSYLSWRNKQSKPTFAFIHVADLYFKNRLTQTEFGESRNYSYESQFEEFDHKLFLLIRELKKEKNYDQTLIILTGLNSHENNQRELDQNLDFNQDQIALLIKATQKTRDQGLSWTYDENVSLADIGQSVFQFFHSADHANPTSELMTMSLIPEEGNHHLSKVTNRWLVSESYSHFQDEMSTISLRKNQFHFVYQNNNLKLFNTLIDKLETSPLSRTDPMMKELVTEVTPLLEKIKANTLNSVKLQKADDMITLFDLLLNTAKMKNHDTILQQLESTEPDILALQDRHHGTGKHAFQNICLQDLDKVNSKIELNNCRDKKILFLNELNENKTEITDSQKRRILNYLSDLRNISMAYHTNQDIGYLQIQPLLETRRWLPFVIALHHPRLIKVRNYFMKVENR